MQPTDSDSCLHLGKHRHVKKVNSSVIPKFPPSPVILPRFLPRRTLSNRGWRGVITQDLMRMKGREGGRERDRAGERTQESVRLVPRRAAETGAEQAGGARGEDRRHICPLPPELEEVPTSPWLVPPAQGLGGEAPAQRGPRPLGPTHRPIRHCQGPAGAPFITLVRTARGSGVIPPPRQAS